mgnify:CR=1 FL=1
MIYFYNLCGHNLLSIYKIVRLLIEGYLYVVPYIGKNSDALIFLSYRQETLFYDFLHLS